MAVLTADGLALADGDTYLFTGLDRYTPAARRLTVTPYAGRPGAVVVPEPPGPRLLRLECVVFAPDTGGDSTAGAPVWRADRDTIVATLSRPGLRISLDCEGDRVALRATVRDLRVARAGRGHYTVAAEFVCEDAYLGAQHPTADGRALALTLAPGETSLRRQQYALSVAGSAPAPIRLYLAHATGAVVPTLWALANLSTGLDAERYPRSPRRLSVVPPTGLTQPATLVWDGDSDQARVLACATKNVTGWWPLCDGGPTLYDLAGNDRDLTPYPLTLTLSGNEITDTVRSAGAQGDGLASPDSSIGVWQAATNLIANGGYESNATGWDAEFNCTIARSSEQAKFGSYSLKATASGNNTVQVGNQTGYAAVSAGTVYSASVWVRGGTALHSASINIRWWTSGGAFVADSSSGASVTLSTTWQRLTVTATAPATATRGELLLTVASCLTGETLYMDGAQVEAANIPTPYVHTDGATAARSNARVRIAAALIDETQGWLAFRLRPGWGTANEPGAGAGYPRLFEWHDGGSSYLRGLYLEPSNQLQLERYNGGAGNAQVVAWTPASGTAATVVMAWTATQIKLSVGGAAFTTLANSNLPTIANTLVDIATAAGSGSHLDGDLLWLAAGTGTLTDADVTTLAALGDTDPTISTLGSTAGVTGVFGCATAYGAGAAVTYQRDCLHATLAGVALDGTRGALESASTAFQFAGSFSWGCWVVFDTLTTAGLFGKAESNKGYYLGAAGGYAVIAAGTGSASVTGTGTAALVTGRRHCLIGVYDSAAQTVTLYQDGVRQAVVSTGGAISHTSANPLRLGAAHHPTGGAEAFVDGTVSEPFAVAAALTEQQVRDVTAAGLHVLGDLVAWRGAPVTVNPRASSTNTLEVRADHASTAPTGRVIAAWRARYE